MTLNPWKANERNVDHTSRLARDWAHRPGLHVEEGAPVDRRRVQATPRIGVVGAEDLKLRFVERGSPYASKPPGSAKRKRPPARA